MVLDNAESILDPQGADEREIYRVVEELSQFPNICLAITSRITLVPPNCKTLEVPTLSMEAARDVFHRIYQYQHERRSDSIDGILEQLGFHPLSITLLATVAHQNRWDDDRLAREWERHHTGVLQTDRNESLGAAIELSLASPMFKQLGPDARDLLGVIAFFPQGVNEANLDWLFPTISNAVAILDKFCILSLTYRSDGFVTMLVPLRDYLRPKNPLSSPLLYSSKESYFIRLSAKSDLFEPGSEKTRWIASEDANVEHLLDVLTSIDPDSDGIWRACANFLDLLYWHKPRQTVLGFKIRHLADDRRFKPDCLLRLAWLSYSMGNETERKLLLTPALKLERERGNDDGTALVLIELSDANRILGLHEEGIHQVKEALGIYERLGNARQQGYSFISLAWLFYDDNQLDAAEDAASRAIQLIQEKGQEYLVSRSHRILGKIHYSKGEREKAIHHFKTALEMASAFNWDGEQFWIYFSLAVLFRDEEKFDEAHAQIEQAKLHVVNDAYRLGCAVDLQAGVCYWQGRLEDAASEALRALEIFDKLGALTDADHCRTLLRDIKQKAEHSHTPIVSSRE